MSFKTLEQRYREKTKELYEGATSKFENGRPSRGFNDDPLNVRRVGDESFGKISQALGRFLPVARALQDVLRITKFTLSLRGVIFLGKQFLLQTGNTFESTRLINPLFTIANAVPFLHVRRHLTPGALLSGLIQRGGDTSTTTVRSMGQLQQGTYDKLTGKKQSFFSSITSAFNAKKNVGWSAPGVTGYNIRERWNISRPELGDDVAGSKYIYTLQNKSGYVFKYGGFVELTNLNTPDADNRYYRSDSVLFDYSMNSSTRQAFGDAQVSRTSLLNEGVAGLRNLAGSSDDMYNLSLQRIARVRYFTEGTPTSRPYGTGMGQNLSLGSTLEQVYTVTREGITENPFNIQKEAYIKFQPQSENGNRTIDTTFWGVTSRYDVANIRKRLAEAAAVNRSFPYDSLADDWVDFITVKIAMGRKDPVRFRAYIKDIQQSSNPQYKEYQYIGRTEKFVSFSGAQREVSFKLSVLAHSQEELLEVWKRINYLTGLVFPFGVSNGVYQPNIARITIGNLYVDQPLYITALSTNFSDVIESWDIDAEIPMGATVDIKGMLIEKNQRVANSPFYGITEQYFTKEYTNRSELTAVDANGFASGSRKLVPQSAAPGVSTGPRTIQTDISYLIQKEVDLKPPPAALSITTVPRLNTPPLGVSYTSIRPVDAPPLAPRPVPPDAIAAAEAQAKVAEEVDATIAGIKVEPLSPELQQAIEQDRQQQELEQKVLQDPQLLNAIIRGGRL